MPAPHRLDYYRFVVNLKLRSVFLFKIVLAILDLLHFHMNFKISLSILQKKKKKKSGLDFNKVCIEFVDQFGKDCHPINFEPYNP